jgi:hypothetical protein
VVQAVAFNGPAAAAGMMFGDIVTEIDVELTGLPPKEFVYPFALILLGIVIFSQRMRMRRGHGSEQAPTAANVEAE